MSSTPPSPPGHPFVGHTVYYATDAFAFLDRAVADVGDVFRAEVLGTGDVYVLAHPDYVEQALVTDRDAFRKSEGFAIAFDEAIVSVEGEQWEGQQDAMREFFYPARIRSYADEMVSLTERRIDRWEGGQRLSIHGEMQSLALEVIFGTMFDRDLALDGDQELRRAAANLNGWFKPSSWALPGWVPTPSRRRFRRAKETIEAEARQLLAERRGGDRGEDFLSTMVAFQSDGDATLSDEEIVDQVAGLIFAGHDTTALALTYAWHSLGTDPAVRERFHAELDDVLGGDRPTLADVGDLEFTEQIVLESLRRYPPIHTIPRETTRDVEVGGYRIPADETVHVALYRIQRDPRFYDDPEAFRPERWDDASPRSKGYAFAPFGAGPRDCLGRRFAMLEATLVLATIGQRFRLDPLADLELAPEMTNQPADDVPARAVER